MNKIAILLTSPKEVGGIYQYSLSVIEALNLLNKKKKFKVEYFYSDRHWEIHLPKNSKKNYIHKSLLKRILRKIVYSILPNNLRYSIFKEFLNEEVNILNKSKSDLIIFPSQNITSYQVNKKSYQQFMI